MSASADWHTPTLTVHDARGLPVRQVSYLREFAGQTASALVTRQTYDIRGALVAQQDPRLPGPNLSNVYNLAGELLRVDSVDAGGYVSLLGLAGEILQRWSARGDHWRNRHDLLLRILEVEENAIPAMEVFTYGSASADANCNLRGQLLNLKDPSGSLQAHGFGLHGALLQETRTFADGQAFISSRRFSPSGALLEQTDAGGHRQQSGYDLAGQLRSLRLQLSGQSGWQTVLQDAHYNAAGQLVEQHDANGVSHYWQYHPASARLQRQRCGTGTAALLQDVEYVYDRVGNITRIVDHLFTPSHFANQRVEGDRCFVYNTLYQLTRATGYDDMPPPDNPGLPQPTDPADRRNYTRTFEYDTGGNLIKTVHVREGGGHTRPMRIDPASNRGVRWLEGDPLPDFKTLFDVHGNLLALQPGQDLQWNARNQLAAVTLVRRADGPDDVEHYHYSQGMRVHKRLETMPGHFHDVRYLPGLEIRSKDNGEVLHVITLASGSGNARCLHWVAGKPAGIEADQLRYTIDDHLGSCVMELDQQARLISHEGYYPFGATAWMQAASAVAVSYKTVRYSAQEMDVSGLYAYGARYYAPWLQRWISSDPAGAVDGLNLYAFVGNNPIGFFDATGLNRSPSELKRQITHNARTLTAIDRHMSTLQSQMIDLQHGEWHWTLARNVVYQLGSAATGWFTSFNAATLASEALPDLSADLIGLTLGNQVADRGVGLYGSIINPLALNTPIVPRTSTFNSAGIQAELQPPSILPSRGEYDMRTPDGVQQFARDAISRVVGAYVPGVGEFMALGSTAQEAQAAEEGLTPMKLGKISDTLDELSADVARLTASNNGAFAELGINEFYDNNHHMLGYLLDLAQDRVGTDKARTVRKQDLQALAQTTANNISTARTFLSLYQTRAPAIRDRYRARQ